MKTSARLALITATLRYARSSMRELTAGLPNGLTREVLEARTAKLNGTISILQEEGDYLRSLGD